MSRELTAEQRAQTIRPDLEMLCGSEEMTAERRAALARIVEHLTPPNLLALLDELERQKTEIIRLSQKSENDPRIHEIIDLKELIAELEARTVTVKLPELKMLSDYLSEVSEREREDILVGVRLEFFRALRAAGLTVEG